MNFHILTLFPEMVLQGLNTSITGRAIQQNKIGLEAVNIRDFSKDKHGRVDDYTYGGGAGMLMQAMPVYDAFTHVAKSIPSEHKKRVIYVTPQGTPFTQNLAQELSESDDLVLICGHYEGIDERVLEEIVTDYISIGDYVLTGGELAAMVIVDAVSRLVPDVLHNEASAETESFHGNLLEYPQYSRPKEWHGKQVPQVLLSGNQKMINEWRKAEAIQRTKKRRPDLYAAYVKLEQCKERMLKQKLLHIDMIELINRGRACLVAQNEDEIILEDKISHTFFHTWIWDARKELDEQSAAQRRENTLLLQMDELCNHPVELITLHQEEFVPVAQSLHFSLDTVCQQAVCTQREQLSVSGLYEKNPKTDSENGKITIERLKMEYLDVVSATYHTVDGTDYVKKRMEKGAVYGAFIEGELAGFIGVHSEGSIGMLEVLPQFRRRKVAMALETYMSNLFIEQGLTPYGHVVIGNQASEALQQKMGACMAKGHVYWMSRKV